MKFAALSALALATGMATGALWAWLTLRGLL